MDGLLNTQLAHSGWIVKGTQWVDKRHTVGGLLKAHSGRFVKGTQWVDC